MSAEGKFEKTRIQNPDEAHEEANMLRVEAGEAPTAEDYDRALVMLEELQEEASHGSKSVDRMTKPMRNALAGFVAAGGAAPELLGLALVNVVGTVGSAIGADSPLRMPKLERYRLIERVKRIADDYEIHKDNLASARERLERWKAEAEKTATGQE